MLDTELMKGIEQAIDKANKSLVPVLVSDVQKVTGIEPLAFYNQGNEQYIGERFFWSDPSGDMILVGMGNCNTIVLTETKDRYSIIENEWDSLMENAVVLNDTSTIGTGPVLFGGFSFDPLKEKTELWSQFGDALFRIPKFLLTVVDGQAYLTTNIICAPNDTASIIEPLLMEREILINNTGNGIGKIKAELLEKREVVHPSEWKKTVDTLVADLKNTSLKKAVLARELRLFFSRKIAVESVLETLQDEQKESYIFAIESNGDCFLGASPERLIKKEGETLFSACVAGSIARGKNDEEDDLLGHVLLKDEKNLIEHDYVVQMIKNAMDKVCCDVQLPSHPQLLKTRDIQHLYTPVVGTAKRTSSLLEVVNYLHPTPALGGYPQREAVDKIRDIEILDRGFYAAPIGWIDHAGNGEFAVAIRSALVQGKEASLFAGCGIVQDSESESEYIETNIKFRPMLSALGGNVNHE